MAQIKIIDALDRKILRALQRDSEEPIADLAARLGLSRSACSRRIARLAEIGVIERSVALLSQSKLGLGLTVFITIKTKFLGFTQKPSHCLTALGNHVLNSCLWRQCVVDDGDIGTLF